MGLRGVCVRMCMYANSARLLAYIHAINLKEKPREDLADTAKKPGHIRLNAN